MQKIEPIQFEELFEVRLRRYDEDRAMLDSQRKDQEALVSQIQESNTSFLNAKRGDNSSKEREQALQRLENAYLKYKEILSNLDRGRTFYNSLAKHVSTFRDESRDFRYQRRVEASQIES